MEKLISLVEFYGGEYTEDLNEADYIITYNPTGEKTRSHEWFNKSIDKKKLMEKTNLFKGLNCCVVGYEKLKKKIEENIRYFGATISSKYDSKITHLITPFKVGTEYNQAVTEEKIIVTAQYFDSCQREEKILDIQSNVIFQPVKLPQKIKGMEKLVISISGYQNQEKLDLIYLIQIAGAKYTPTLSKNENTHLIIEKPVGEKHQAAVETNRIVIKNKQWLFNIIKNWSISYHFLLSQVIFEKTDVKYILESLGGDGSDKFSSNITHTIISDKLTRTEKVLCSLSSCIWVLKPSFLGESKECGFWVDEKKHQWSGSKFDNNIWESSPSKWKNYYEETGKKAFEGWKVILGNEKTGPSPNILKDIIRAGNGEIVTDFNSNDQSPNRVMIVENEQKSNKQIEKYAKMGVKFFKGIYILDYLSFEKIEIENYEMKF